MAHIPSGTTAQMELVTFRQALEAANTPNEEYDVNKWLYAPNFYSEYRYILGTRGNNPLICIGINPSTAKPDDLDNTLKSVQRIALANGFDSFLMFNVYAQRATDPDSMEKECNAALHQENLAAFRYLLELYPQPSVWAAWGAIIEKRGYLRDCLIDQIRVRAGHWRSAFVIGGYVRDCFLGRPSKDIDIVVEGSGIELAEAVGERVRSYVSVFKNFGTAMLKFKGIEVEFVGARKESYRRDSRKPIVA